MKTKKAQPEPAASEPMDIAVLNQYGSIAQCSAHLGIPVSAIRFAKKGGCLAFANSRVYTLPLIRWLFAQEENQSGINWGERLKEYQAKREKVKLDKDQKLSVDRNDIAAGLSKGMSVMFSVMDRKFKLELPPALKGLDEAAIQIRLDEVCQSLQEGLRSELEKLAEEKEEAK